MKKLFRHLILLIVGGLAYMWIEILFRGMTHWTMFLVGGLCFVLVGGLNNWFPWEMPILEQMGISAFMITVVEFLAGVILNILIGLSIWDYSNMPFNILGQICLPFTIIWFFISFVAIVMDDLLRWWWFGEQFPKYSILKHNNERG